MIPLTRWQTEMLVALMAEQSALMAEQSALWQLPDDPFDPAPWFSTSGL